MDSGLLESFLAELFTHPAVDSFKDICVTSQNIIKKFHRLFYCYI